MSGAWRGSTSSLIVELISHENTPPLVVLTDQGELGAFTVQLTGLDFRLTFPFPVNWSHTKIGNWIQSNHTESPLTYTYQFSYQLDSPSTIYPTHLNSAAMDDFPADFFSGSADTSHSWFHDGRHIAGETLLIPLEIAERSYTFLPTSGSCPPEQVSALGTMDLAVEPLPPA